MICMYNNNMHVCMYSISLYVSSYSWLVGCRSIVGQLKYLHALEVFAVHVAWFRDVCIYPESMIYNIQYMYVPTLFRQSIIIMVIIYTCTM